MTIEQVNKILSGYPGVTLDEKEASGLIIYSLAGEVVAAIVKDSRPLRMELRCDWNLANTLRDRYESVLDAKYLNKRRFATFIDAGQLNESELADQIRHAYEQTKLLVDLHDEE